MTLDAAPGGRQLTVAPLDEKIDHVRGPAGGRLIVEYGDYECPYSRQAFHAIEQVEHRLDGNLRFAFRHFPLTRIHPHALAAAAAAEAAARQGQFWEMHELLFHRQKALEDDDLLGYAAGLGLAVAAFDRDRTSAAVAGRIRRDVDSGLASGQVLGTPTLFIDGIVHRGGYDPPALLAALGGKSPASGEGGLPGSRRSWAGNNRRDTTVKVHRWKTITALAAAASLALAIGAASSQAAPAVTGTKASACLSASDLSKLPLTDRHLTGRENCNLAVVLRAYHDGEGSSLDPQGFRELFATDGVLNGIGNEQGQTSLRGTQLSGLITFLAQFLPDIHRQLKQITVSGDVVSIELSIQGTFLGPFQTPAGEVKPTGAKIDFPTADFWYLRNGKVEVFDCHIAFTTLFAQLGILPDYAAAVAG